MGTFELNGTDSAAGKRELHKREKEGMIVGTVQNSLGNVLRYSIYISGYTFCGLIALVRAGIRSGGSACTARTSRTWL